MRHLATAAFLVANLGYAPAVMADDEVGFRGCGARAEVTHWLSLHFDEAPLARGVQGDGRLFELYAARAGATWTIVITDAEGVSCIVNEGTSLEVLPLGATEPVA
jgi:hypothetical protein